MRVLNVVFVVLVAFCALAHGVETDFDIVLDNPQIGSLNNIFGLKENQIHALNNVFPEELAKEIATLAKTNDQDGIRATVNEYAEQIFKNLKPFLLQNGLDPFQMPDLATGFNFTFIIRYTGELSLKKGWLQQISSIHRGDGNVVVVYNNQKQYLQVTVPIKFDVLEFEYDYVAKLMGLGPTGGVEGKVTNVGVEVKLGFNTSTLNATLDQFTITDSGHISLHLNGNALVDWIINLLSEVATTLLKPAILMVVEVVIRGGLTFAVKLINQTIHSILDPAVLLEASFKAAEYFA